MTLFAKSAAELHELLKTKAVSALELTESVLERIEKIEPKVLSYLKLTPDWARAQARAVQSRIEKEGIFSPIAGIPIAIKDNLCTQGISTTCASKILAKYTPPYHATVVERLLSYGAIPVGKTNLDEFAMGSSTENSAFQVTRNPWNLDRVPGGSSGGSAAAVSADEAVLALGSDTGGSIRQPASFCGVVGLKPTYGRVSRYGLVAFASSLDQIGPITKTVEDCAILLTCLSGHDPRDSTSANLPVPNFREALGKGIKGKKIGLIQELSGEGIDPVVTQAMQKAMDTFTELGASVEIISMPTLKYALPTYYILAPAEASSNLARYDGVRYGFRDLEAKDILTMYYRTRDEGFGPEVKRRILLGTYALSAGYYDAYYLKAQKVRTLIKNDFERAYETFDLLASPVAPTPAFKIGEKVDDPLQMYLSDIATIPVNLAGIPALSLPCGFSEGLPIGLQLLGKFFDEATLLQVAYAYEQRTEWHKQKPMLGHATHAKTAEAKVRP